MADILIIAGVLIGAIIGFIAGFFLGRAKSFQPPDLTPLNSMSTQIAEMKVQFEQMEKARASLERAGQQLGEEKEKRLKEWMDNTAKIFAGLKEQGSKTDIEKEKRIQEWMESTKKFFEEQKQATEKFLEAENKARKDLEENRNAQLKDMRELIERFTRTISGNKTRGNVGEEILKEVLINSIQSGLVVTNLKTDGGDVEFGWKVDTNKYIPIDAKTPDIFDLVNKYNSEQNPDVQRDYKRQIVNKVKGEIKNVQKYQNQPNTTDVCMIVVPPAALEIAPETISIGKEANVYVCTYIDVFPIAHVLQDQYDRMKKEGDVGQYKHIIKTLFLILDKINARTDTIIKSVTTITNANNEIREEVAKGKTQAES